MGSVVGRLEEGDAQNFNLPPPSERHRCPGKASDLLAQRTLVERRGLKEGHSVVVVADIAAPYNLRQEQRGELVKVDEDGDAFVRFYGDEELWMHRSVLHLLAAESGSIGFCGQLLELFCSLLMALCLGQVLAAFPAAISAAAFADDSHSPVNTWPLLAPLLALPAFDIPQVRALLFSFPDIAPFFGPTLFAASQLPLGPSGKLVLLGLSVLAHALGGLEELHFSTAAFCRQRDGWAYLAAVPLSMALGRLSNSWAAALGLAAAMAAVALSLRPPEVEVLLRQHRAQASAAAGSVPVGSKAPWPPNSKLSFADSFALAMLGGGLLILHQLYVSSLEAPAELCFADPTPWQSRPLWVCLWLGVAVALLPETCRGDGFFVTLVAVLPLLCALLQIFPPAQAPGVGDVPFAALGLLVFNFPSMLVLFLQRLCRLARNSWGGSSIFLALALWATAMAMQMAPYLGTVTAPVRPLQAWTLALMASTLWLLGSATGSAAKDTQVGSLRRPNAFTASGSVILTFAAIGFSARVLSELREDSFAAVAFSNSTLVVAEFGTAEASSTACLSEVRRHVDLVGLRNSGGPPEASAILAKHLRLLHYSGTPGAGPPSSRALLSGAKLQNVTANWREGPSKDIADWVRARILWRGTWLTYFGAELHAEGDPSAQLSGLAAALRKQDGPLIVSGRFPLHRAQPPHPADPAADLRKLLQGAGLEDAFGTVAGRTQQTAFLRDLVRMDYVFYRGLELADARIESPESCVDNLPLIVSFQLKTGKTDLSSP